MFDDCAIRTENPVRNSSLGTAPASFLLCRLSLPQIPSKLMCFSSRYEASLRSPQYWIWNGCCVGHQLLRPAEQHSSPLSDVPNPELHDRPKKSTAEYL